MRKNKKTLTHQKDTNGQTIEANESALFPVLEIVNTVAGREAAFIAANQREDSANQREEAANRREEGARTKVELGELTKAQLREANEHLIVATVQAQSMTDVAKQATAQMAYIAEYDFLTGLPNRMLLTDRLEQAIIFAQRHRKNVALIYVNVDHFKHINDSLGHEIGDQLLQSVAKRLQACVRLSDTVSRQ